MAPVADARLQALSAALERERSRRERLGERVDDLTRRLDRLELRVLVLATAGSLGGTIIGTGGVAAAKAIFGG